MQKGRHTCEQLKAIRKEIAKANDIDYIPSECHFQGLCQGSCPACESECAYIEQQLSLREKAGKVVKIIGLAATLTTFPAQETSAQERQTMNSDSLVWENYMFDFGQIKPESEQQIDEMAEFITENPDKLYLVIGHTDERGNETYNLKLSRKRAEYVTYQIRNRINTANTQIIPIGLGFYQPHIKNAKEEFEHEQNRRASLEIYNPARFKGKNSALIELAIFKGDDKKRLKFEKRFKQLGKKIYKKNLDAQYEKLAREIRKERKFFEKKRKN